MRSLESRETDSGRVRGIAVGFAILAATAVFAIAGCEKPAAPMVPPTPTVGVIESKRMNVPIEVNPNGTTRALENVMIRARVRGFLTERHFVEGATVRKGQLLFVIDEEPYQVTLLSARARLAEAEAALRKAEESKVPEVSASQLSLDEAQLLLAQIQEKRNRTLVTKKAGSAEDLDKSEAERKRWESQVHADEASLSQAKADHAVGIASSQALVAAAKAAVREAELNLGYCRMVAPIDGRIGEAKVKVGNLVGPDPAGGGTYTDLATIQQLDPMGVDLRLSSRDLDRTTSLIEGGLVVRLSRPGPAGPQDFPQDGRCFFIDNNVDETTSTFLVKATIPNPGGKLLPGEYVKVKMVVDQLQDAVVVPATSVVESDSGTVVHIVDKQGKVEVRRVVAGQTHEGLRVITKGLDPGVTVIVDGLQRIRPGLSVKTEPAVLTRRANDAIKVTNADAVAKAKPKS